MFSIICFCEINLILTAEEDSYIQQMTKVIINVGGIPGEWMEPAGLPAEIVPLSKPCSKDAVIWIKAVGM